jgi:hypothetical protein
MDRTTILMGVGTAATVCLALLFVTELKFSAPAAVARPSKTDAEMALDSGKLDEKTARVVQALKRDGIRLSLAELEAAKNDAPASLGSGTIAEIAKPAYESLNPRDADRARHHAICFSIRRENGIEHDIVYYNTAHFYKMGDMGLYAWIRSGCADAIRTSTQTLSKTAYMGKVLGLVPKDDLHEWIRDSISMNMQMACGDEVRQRFKGLSAARRVQVEGAEMERCRKLSKL